MSFTWWGVQRESQSPDPIAEKSHSRCFSKLGNFYQSFDFSSKNQINWNYSCLSRNKLGEKHLTGALKTSLGRWVKVSTPIFFSLKCCSAVFQGEGGWELPTMKAQKLLQNWNYTVILSLAVKCLLVYSRTLNIPIRYPEHLLLVIDANSMFLSFSPITYSRLSLRCWKYWMSLCCLNFALILALWT